MHRLLLAMLAAPLMGCALFVLPGVGGELGIKVPHGFDVSKFAGDELAHDVFSITTDAHGRIAVSGPGYVKILEDRDGDGAADHAHRFAEIKSGAMGMYFDGPDLIYTGDNKVARLRDTDGDGAGDGEEVVWTRLRNGEHGSHNIVKGPDGWFYIAAGNDAGVSGQHATAPASPIKDPSCGAILRFSPDGMQSEIVADGFRNMCGLDFNAAGHLFTVDSDNERDQHLPWYCPTRLFDVAIGQSHGWLQTGFQHGWNRPQYFFDSTERLAEFGRGSPTGVMVYRHRSWPDRYNGGVFSACWSMSRIYFCPLTPRGASYESTVETFLEADGATGLAIVGMTIDPAGDMYFAVGGRKTQGAVFRVRYTGPKQSPSAEELQQQTEVRAKLGDKLFEVLWAPQPLSNWSRAKWRPAAQEIGKEPFAEAAADETLPRPMRVRAIEILVECFDGIDSNLARAVAKSSDAEVAARVGWALGRRPRGKATVDLLRRFAGRKELAVQRAAYEALATLDLDSTHIGSVAGAISSNDFRRRDAVYRRIVSARSLVISRLVSERLAAMEVLSPEASAPLRTDQAERRFEWQRLALGVAREFGRRSSTASDDALLILTRALQIEAGDIPHWSAKPEVFCGYTSASTKPLAARRMEIVRQLASAFPYADQALNREAARLFAMVSLNEPALPQAIVASCTKDSSLEDDIHYLICLARLPGSASSDTTLPASHAIVMLHHKLAARGAIASRNWPLRLGELFVELCKRDPNFAEAVIDDERFGLPGHALFVSKLSGDAQIRAARKLLAAVKKSGVDWDTDLIAALAVLPSDELRPDLKERFDDPALRDAITVLVAQSPQDEDQDLLVQALSSVQPNVVRVAAGGLAQIKSKATPAEIAEALRALRRQTLSPNEHAARDALVELLKKWTGQAISTENTNGSDLAAVYRPWFDWFAQAHPKQASSLAAFTGNTANWSKRLASIDWRAGDATRGKAVFEKRSCHRCHANTGRLGPSLAGAATRFSREDLFAAIVDPNKEVAPAYETTEVVTDDGQVYNGLIVYESPDSTMLQTGPDTVVRISGVRKDGMRKSRVSLMPIGLLNEASDQDLVDLYTYLRTLTQ